MAKVAVVGGGVVGLSTALNVKRRLPGTQVTIFADKFDKDTVSSGAGGLFRPNLVHTKGRDSDSLRRWSTKTFKFYSGRAQSAEARDSGHMIMPGYVFSNKALEDPLYKQIVFSFRELTPQELKSLGVDYRYGYQVTTVVTDMSRYLPWLTARFKESGGVIVEKTVKTLEEFVGKYDVVVNCAAFGSRELVGDQSMYPVKGHLIKMKAPWIKYWVYTDDNAYFIPSFDGLSVGGVRQKGNYSLDVDPEVTKGILERNFKLWPALKGATILREWVALRPHRDPVRVERETLRFNKGSIEVVHNYGHGAGGVTYSWGSSLEATDLVCQALKVSKSKL